mmetsp:Transcript_8175/g.20591  ORF Transcript_8175/g.20591 Transcript_8175/m.20591 type:complete len:1338 (-) Transcript_8175:215-4228(-)
MAPCSSEMTTASEQMALPSPKDDVVVDPTATTTAATTSSTQTAAKLPVMTMTAATEKVVAKTEAAASAAGKEATASIRSRPAVGFQHPPSPQTSDNIKDMGNTGDVPDQTNDEPGKKRRRLHRLVSQDGLARESFWNDPPPPCPNPLSQDARILRHHITALRLETDLHPLRLLLSRLMNNQTHNRKGIFNEPVDPVALNLPDYASIVKRPMDLGTVKKRLYALAYQSRQNAADDTRLVFTNAMLYNPPNNIIHKCAAELLSYFDSCYAELDACVQTTPETGTGSETHAERPTKNDCVGDQKTRAISSRTDGDVAVPSAPSSTQPSTRTSDVASSSSDGICRNRSKKVPKGITRVEITDVPTIQRKRRHTSFMSTPTARHYCADCKGRTCFICKQGCLQHENSLLVCCGVFCAGSRIRKGAMYFISPDGALQFCERCHSSLPSALSEGATNGTPRYKQELLKRRNDEEVAEEWIACRSCEAGVHAVCAVHNSFIHDPSTYLCPSCVDTDAAVLPSSTIEKQTEDATASAPADDQAYTFVSGGELPIPLSQLTSHRIESSLDADRLPECPISKFIQEKTRSVIAQVAPNAEKTVTVRIISDCDRQFDVPEAIRRYFRMETSAEDDDGECVRPPSSVEYRQKAITMFQKIDGIDVCIFCMFVQEYADQQDLISKGVLADKRVYIAYIDSLSHFRPREVRTEVFHEILISYLATARERGFERANIWSCPPSRGNCFVFWNHPASQRTPNADRLQAWYHTALATAVRYGVVTDVKSLYETDFEKQVAAISHDDSPLTIGSVASGKMICPPLIDGDFWVEEAARIHGANITKLNKVRTPSEVCVWNVASLNDADLDPCPALQVAAVIKNRVMTHPASVPFRRAVNAAAMKLKNYHCVVKKPMDLGTMYAKCVLGEYGRMRDVVDDLDLMTTNAEKFNPPGHIVHKMANEIAEVFHAELNVLVQLWKHDEDTPDITSWQTYEDMSMNLDVEIEIVQSSTPEPMQASVLVEDDLSTDASKSLSSSVALSLSDSTSRPTKQTKCKVDEGDSSVSGKPQKDKRNEKPADSASSRSSKRRAGRPKVERPPEEKICLLTGDPKAIQQQMAGEDTWLLEKKTHSSVKKDGKRRRQSLSGDDDSSSITFPNKPRRPQSWLCEELAKTIRRMRASFFSCSLLPNKDMTAAEKEKLTAYEEYSSSFCPTNETLVPPSLADARSAILELCQFRHLEFDTLRRAKYSTSMLLYHLHHLNAPGLSPICASCGTNIAGVRWHKVEKIENPRQAKKSKKASTPNVGKDQLCIIPPGGDTSDAVNAAATNRREELCTECCKSSTCMDSYIPIMVSNKFT